MTCNDEVIGVYLKAESLTYTSPWQNDEGVTPWVNDAL